MAVPELGAYPKEFSVCAHVFRISGIGGRGELRMQAWVRSDGSFEWLSTIRCLDTTNEA